MTNYTGESLTGNKWRQLFIYVGYIPFGLLFVLCNRPQGGSRFEWWVLTLQALIWLTLTNENITNVPIKKIYKDYHSVYFVTKFGET